MYYMYYYCIILEYKILLTLNCFGSSAFYFILIFITLFRISKKWNFIKIYNIFKVVVKLLNSFINIFIFKIEFSLQQWLWFLDCFNWISIFYKWSHLLTWKFSTSLISWACMYPGSAIYIPVMQQDGIYLTKVFESLMFYSLDSCTEYKDLLHRWKVIPSDHR